MALWLYRSIFVSPCLTGSVYSTGLASQTFAVLSSLPVTIREPSGLNDAESDPAGVPLECEDLGTTLGVPDLRRLVAYSR